MLLSIKTSFIPVKVPNKLMITTFSKLSKNKISKKYMQTLLSRKVNKLEVKKNMVLEVLLWLVWQAAVNFLKKVPCKVPWYSLCKLSRVTDFKMGKKICSFSRSAYPNIKIKLSRKMKFKRRLLNSVILGRVVSTRNKNRSLIKMSH